MLRVGGILFGVLLMVLTFQQGICVELCDESKLAKYRELGEIAGRGLDPDEAG